MNKWTTRTVLTLSAVALTSGLTACGSSDSSPEARPASAAPTVTAPSVTQPALAAPGNELGEMSTGNIRQGSSGYRVKCVQWGVNTFNPSSYRLTVDGIFGSRTARAVRKYQSSRGLSADGIVGPRTAGKLRADTQHLIYVMNHTGDHGATGPYTNWLRNCSGQLPG